METGVVKQAKFIFKAHKYQLVQLDVKFYPTNDPLRSGLMKTSFKVFLDGKFLGYVPLDMLAIIPEGTKDEFGHQKLQVVLKTNKPYNFNSIPFTRDMKLSDFVGKIFKQEHMTEIHSKDNSLVSIVRDRHTIKRGRRKNKR